MHTSPNLPSLPVCLTIAGSDSGGGAGIQADLRTFTACGTFGTSAITAITAQNPHGVRAIHPVPLADLLAQVAAVREDFDVRAIKTGMLYAADLILGLAGALRAAPSRPPLVVDPVMVATSGARLLQADAVAALTQALLPLATVVTPNLPEAEILFGQPLSDAATALAAGRRFVARHGVALLLKGGHLPGEVVCDFLITPDACHELRAPRLATASTHGTGCTLSAALAAHLAFGQPLLTAAIAAKAFVHLSLANARQVGPAVSAMYPPAQLTTDFIVVRTL